MSPHAKIGSQVVDLRLPLSHAQTCYEYEEDERQKQEKQIQLSATTASGGGSGRKRGAQ